MSVHATGPSGQTTRSEPQSFRARDLTASLTVRDLETSLAWYRDVLGFVVEKRHERRERLIAVSLKAGRVELLLTQDDGAKGWDRQKGEGISLQFTTLQSVDGFAERVKASGGVLQSEPIDTPWGARVFRVVDPDGFKLVFTTGS